MAEFGIQATQLDGPRLAGSQPVAPVAQPDRSPVLPMGLLGLGVKIGEDVVAQAKANDAAGVLSSYQQQLSGVASALSGGHISEREALTRTQRISNQFASQYADGTGEILKSMGNIRKEMFAMTSLQFAAEAQEDTRAAKKQAVTDAITRGLLSPFGSNYSPDMQAQAVSLAQAQQRADDEWSRLQKRSQEERSIESHQFSADANYRANKEFTDTQAAKNAVSSVRTQAAAYLDSSIDELGKQLKGGAIDFSTAQMSLNRITAELNGQVSSLMVDNPQAARVVTDQINAMQQAALTHMDPTKTSAYTAAAYTDAINRVKLALVTDDPNMMIIAATSAMAPNLPITQLYSNQALTKAFTAAQQGRYSGLIVGNDINSQRVLFKGIQDTVNKTKAGMSSSPPEKAMAEAGQMTNAFIREAGKVDAGDPASLRTFTQFMATPEVAILVNEGQIDKQTAAMTRQAFASTYQRDVLMNITPKLNAPLGASVTADGQTVQPNLANVVDFEMQGGQLVMVPKPSREMYASPQLIRARNQEVNDVMRELNTLIKAGAHLAGTTDYNAYWEQNKHVIMPDFFISPEKEAAARKQGYQGGNRRNPANWRKPDGGADSSTE